jgi:hypothetical protein
MEHADLREIVITRSRVYAFVEFEALQVDQSVSEELESVFSHILASPMRYLMLCKYPYKGY